MKAPKMLFNLKTLGLITLISISTLLIYLPMTKISAQNTDPIEYGFLPPDRPAVFIYPRNVTAEVGDYVTFSVKVHNLTDNTIELWDTTPKKYSLGNLFGFAINLTWNPLMLEYVNHTVFVPVEEYPYGVLHEPVTEVLTRVNTTSGYIFVSYSSQGIQAEPFNNEGQVNTMFNVTFRVRSGGGSYIRLESTELAIPYFRPEFAGYQSEVYHHPRFPYPGFISDAYIETMGAPFAEFTYWPPDAGVAGKPVIFNASESYDPDGEISLYMWDFGDGTAENTSSPVVEHSFSETGDFYVTLTVIDNEGTFSAPNQKKVTIVSRREVILSDYWHSEQLDKTTRMGWLKIGEKSVKIYVTLKNDGYITENVTLTAYYNKTPVIWDSLSAMWEKITEKPVVIPPGIEAVETLVWDTTEVVPEPEMLYCIMVNITSPIPYEDDTTNNVAPRPPDILPTYIFLTNKTEYDLSIKVAKAVYVGKGDKEFAISLEKPAILGECVDVTLVVRRNGTVTETFNATVNILDSEGNVLESLSQKWELIQLTEREMLLPYKINTTLLDAGEYTLIANTTNSNSTLAAMDKNPGDNSVIFKFRVIKPPSIQLADVPEDAYVDMTVIFDASNSSHPSGEIVKFSWEAWRGTTKVKTGTGPIFNVTFDATGRWRIILTITDNYGLSYNEQRPSTDAYRKAITILVAEKEGGLMIPTEFLIGVVVIVVVIMIAFIVYKRRKGGT